MTYKGTKWAVVFGPYQLDIDVIDAVARARAQFYDLETSNSSVEYYWNSIIGLVEVIGKSSTISWEQLLGDRASLYYNITGWNFRNESVCRFYYDKEGNWHREYIGWDSGL